MSDCLDDQIKPRIYAGSESRSYERCRAVLRYNGGPSESHPSFQLFAAINRYLRLTFVQICRCDMGSDEPRSSSSMLPGDRRFLSYSSGANSQRYDFNGSRAVSVTVALAMRRVKACSKVFTPWNIDFERLTRVSQRY